MDPRLRNELLATLTESRRLGFLGPGPVEDQLDVSLAIGEVLRRVLALLPPRSMVADAEGVRAHPEALAADPAPDVAEVLDLGAGGGVPGLVIAAAWPEVHWTLLDVQQRRVRFLAETVEGLGLGRRVEVVGERAELFGRRESSRAHFAVVVARGFGSPSATAEMAAPLVRVGGAVLVSEPPGAAGERWPSGPLRKLGLVYQRIHPGVPAVAELHQEEPCPSWAPRRVGLPAKRPLF